MRSHSYCTSPVFRAIPPSMPLVGVGRTYAFSTKLSRSILVLSPRIEPPDLCELGSIVSTARFIPRSSVICSPNFSISEDLPAPGDPHRPIRRAGLRFGVRRNSSFIILSASSLWASREDSIKVIVRLRAERSLNKSRSTLSETS